jgi:putative oxidoreductase
MSMFGGSGPRPMIPALSRMYPQAEQWGYLLLRVVAGAMLVPHGWPKLMAGPAAIAAGAMKRRGIEPAYAVALIAIFLEIVGAACIVLGLLTRPVALLLVIEFVIITYSHLTMGGWGVGVQGAEFAFLWMIVFVYILARGGGQYSVDAKLGKEF